MDLIDALFDSLSAGTVHDVRVGAFWTAVVVDIKGQQRCGLAATLRDERNHHHGSPPPVKDAGQLVGGNAGELAQLIRSRSAMEASIGMAAINAMLPRQEGLWTDLNAAEVIAEQGAGKRVALVGHFPFVSRLREQVDQLWVLELQPQGDDLPASDASEIIPQADVVAITGTTLINHTFAGLIEICQPDSLVLVLGPSTPLSPILFDYGVDLISGTVVEDVQAVLRGVSQGATFRQVHQLGVRLITMQNIVDCVTLTEGSQSYISAE